MEQYSVILLTAGGKDKWRRTRIDSAADGPGADDIMVRDAENRGINTEGLVAGKPIHIGGITLKYAVELANIPDTSLSEMNYIAPTVNQPAKPNIIDPQLDLPITEDSPLTPVLEDKESDFDFIGPVETDADTQLQIDNTVELADNPDDELPF